MSVIIDMAVNGIFMCSVFVISTQYIQATSSFEFPETHVVDGQEILTPKLNENTFCVSLKNCKYLSWLLQETTNLSIISQEQLIETLKEKRCELNDIGSDDEITLETKVECPNINDISVGSNDQTEDSTEDDYEVRSIINLKSSSVVHCSLQIQHAAPDTLKDWKIKALSGERKKYHNLRRLAGRTVLRITADGSCCWKVYTAKRFGGEPSLVTPDDPIIPENSIKSTKQVECES